MSILIKGIDVPTNCPQCPCSNDESRFCRAANKYIPMLRKPDFCPLEEAEERKTGHWIDIPHTFLCKCSECGWINDHDSGFKWCPDCGADMRGAEE